MKEQHHIYWWNLENLFDVQNSPTRPAWFQSRMNRELKGWTKTVLSKKIANLCSVIKLFNNGLGPDIFGVCEVENEAVVTRLMNEVNAAIGGRNYKVMHQDTKDQRGIDIAIIYDQNKYTDDGQIFSLEIMKRNATRDLVQVNLTTKKGNELILIGNHWPSRLGGQYESEPYRMMVAETLSYWISRILEIKGKTANIVVMGDFNDQPYDRSMIQYLNSTNNWKKTENARSIGYLFNLMFPFLDGKLGTNVYGSEISVIDQFLVSKGIKSKGNYPFEVEKTSIVNFANPKMVKGDYNTPIRFGRPSSKSSFNVKGFSDHLPIELVLLERDND